MISCIPLSIAVAVAGLAAPDAVSRSHHSTISIDVDTSALGEFGDALQQRLNYEIAEELKDRQMTLDRAATRRIVVSIGSSSARHSGYRYVIKTTDASGTTAATEDKCEPCTDELTVRAIMKVLPAQIDAAIRDGADAAAHDVSEDPSADDAVRPPAAEETLPAPIDRTSRSRQEIAGFALIGTGAALTIGGVVMAALPRSYEPDSGRPTQARARDIRTPGIVILAAGVGALATGIGMVVVGAKKRKRDIVAAPSVGRDHVGFGIAGRF